MELRHIRYFIAVAEERHFSRAAARLGIGQPPLSLQIKDLENEVGAKLFHRTSRGARLTEAGQTFYESVRDIPLMTNDAAALARRAARGEKGCLSLGVTGSCTLHPLTASALRCFRRRFPNIEVSVTEGKGTTLMDAVLDGKLDAALVRSFSSTPDGLIVTKLIEEKLVAVLPSSHALANREDDPEIADFKDERFIMFPRSSGSIIFEATMDACLQAGFEPPYWEPAPQIVAVLTMIAAEIGVAFVPESMAHFNLEGVTIRTLKKDAPTVPLGVAIRSDAASSASVNFRRCILCEIKGYRPYSDRILRGLKANDDHCEFKDIGPEELAP